MYQPHMIIAGIVWEMLGSVSPVQHPLEPHVGAFLKIGSRTGHFLTFDASLLPPTFLLEASEHR